MWWGIGIGAVILYLVVLFTIGLMTLRNRTRLDVLLRDLLPDTLGLRRLHETHRGLAA